MVEGFISPVRRSTATGLNTGVAIAGTGTAVTVDLALRDSSGTAIELGPGAFTTLPVTPLN